MSFAEQRRRDESQAYDRMCREMAHLTGLGDWMDIAVYEPEFFDMVLMWQHTLRELMKEEIRQEMREVLY